MSQYDKDSLLLIQAIHRVIEWLESLLDEDKIVIEPSSAQGQRIFNEEECDVLSLESRHYLLMLEKQGVLTPVLRERIIHHAMLLDLQTIELPVVEGIARILLSNQPEVSFTLDYFNRTWLPGNSQTLH